jgi:hypothetical protein
MKRTVVAIVALSLVALVLVLPAPAAAWGGPVHVSHGGFHRGGGHFLPGFALGALAGVALGTAFAPVYAAPPVYYPAPRYVAPPPVCYPPQWVWNGYGWVLQPGYCR